MTPSNNSIVLRWSLLCVALLITLWLGIWTDLRRDHENWSQRALQDVRTLAENHAEQLQKSIEQIDLISSSLMFMKESGVLPAILDEQFQYMITESPLYFAYIDSEGYIRSARNVANLGAFAGKQAFMAYHRQNSGRAMLINPRTKGLGTRANEEVVRFTRRVNNPDGSFNGVITVTLPHRYLQSVKGSALFAEGDFSSVWLQDGPMLTNWTVGLGDEIYQHYKQQPVFATASGARLEAAGQFHRPQANYVGWRKLDNYPIFALSAISETNALRSYELARTTMLLAGFFSSVLLTVGTMLLVAFQIQRAQRRRRLNELQTRFRVAADTGQQALLMILPVFDAHGLAIAFTIEDCSMGTSLLTGLDRHDLLGKTLAEIFSPGDASTLGVFLQAVLRDGAGQEELQLTHVESGSLRWIDSRAVRSGAGIALTIHDVTELKDKQSALVSMARTDGLTSLPNRVWLSDHLPAALAQADAQGHRLALIFLDLDDFKRINDALGHAAGDDLLIACAKVLLQTVRPDDQVARIGGDEFAVLARCSDRPAALGELIVQLHAALSRLNCTAVLHGHVIDAAIGIAVYPDDTADAAALINAADIALYDAKLAGKSSDVYYSQAMHEKLHSRYRLEQELRHALQHEELRLVFQPRVLASTGMLSSFEALVRWHHPERGLIPPGQFIDVAEESGLIVELGDWVIEHTCRTMAHWRQQGLPLCQVSLNVSAKQLKSSGCRQQFLASMAAHDIGASLLAIELTESTMVGDDAVVRHELRELRKLGLELHIDDFGTGYSSLSQLQQLDIDVIKIDQSFVRELGVRKQGEALCRAIIQICKALDFTVVAEGVETHAQLHLLQDMACDEIQGYLLSRPVPADQAAIMLAHPDLLGAVDSAEASATT